MMKKWMLLLPMVLLLTGCGAEDTFETISDELVLPVMAQPRNISVELPGEAALPVIENSDGRIYICNDYEIILQTLDAGDLEETLKTLSGLSREDMTVVETFADGISRYEFAWASAGETGDQTGRGVVLDDGNYHYCMSVLRSAASMEQSQIDWDQVFGSFSLASY